MTDGNNKELREAVDMVATALGQIHDKGPLAGHSRGYEYCADCGANLGAQPVQHRGDCEMVRLAGLVSALGGVPGAE